MKQKTLCFIMLGVLLLTLSAVQGGHIFTQDPVIDLTNFEASSVLEFKFMLENGISSTDFLNIVLPFTLGGAIKITWYPIPAGVCITPELKYRFPAELATFSGGSYFIKFRDYWNNQVGLAAMQWYTLVIDKDTGISTVAGVLNPVQAYTTSDTSGNFITYDYNTVFALLRFSAQVTNNLEVYPFVISDVASRNFVIENEIGTLSEFHFEILPRIAIPNRARIKIELDISKGFNFTNPEICESIVASRNTPALSPKSYSCNLETSNVLWINIYNTLKEESVIRFKTLVQYPRDFKVVSSGATFYTLLPNEKTIVESRTFNLVFRTLPAQWNPNSLKIKVAWGLKPSELFGIYRRGSASKDYFFNTLRFEFSPARSVPQGTKSDIAVIINQGSAIVLGNSITTNLPAFEVEKPVSCSFTNANIEGTSVTAVRCVGVGVLTQFMTYYIAFRIEFEYLADDLNYIANNFGKIALYPYDASNTVSTSSIFIPAGSSETLFIRNNEPTDNTTPAPGKTVDSLPANGGTALSTAFGSVSAVTLKSTNQALLIKLNVGTTTFGNLFNSGTGIDIYSSAVIEPSENYFYQKTDCSADATGGSPAFGICNIKKVTIDQSNPSVQSTNYRIAASDPASHSYIFTTTAVGVRYIAFDRVNVKRHASLYPDQYLLDFYLGFTSNGLTTSSNTGMVYNEFYVFNSYTLSPNGVLSDIEIYLTHFFKGDVGNDGKYFPTVFRITGKLSADEKKSNFNKIIIFFDYALGFDNGFDCGTTVSYANCKYMPGTVRSQYQAKHRISVTMPRSFADGFQTVIPIQIPTTYTAGSISCDIALADMNDQIIFLKSKNLNPATYVGGTTLDNFGDSTISGADFNLQLKNKRVGSSDRGTLNAFFTTTGSPFTANTVSAQGAAFIWMSNYAFFDIPNLTITPGSQSILGTDPVNEKCLTMKYNYALNDPRWVLWCPLMGPLGRSSISSLNIDSLRFPYKSGIQKPVAFGTVSTNTGRVIYMTKNEQSPEIMDPAEIVIESGSMTTPLYNGERNMFVGFYFNTTSYLPNIVKLQITSNTPLNFVIPEIDTKCFYSLVFSDVTANTITTTCNVKFFDGSIIATLVGDIEYPPGKYLLTIRQIDVNNYPVSAQDLLINFYTTSDVIIARTFKAGQIYYKNNEVRPYSIQILDSNYQHRNAKVRGHFNISFTLAGRDLLETEKIRITLEPLSLSNEGETVYCTVRNPDRSLNFDWKTCSMSGPLNTIELVPKKLIPSSNKVYYLFLTNIKVPVSKVLLNVTASVIDPNNYAFLSSSANLPEANQLTARWLEHPRLLVEKMFSSVGFSPILRFWITPAVVTLNSTAFLYIKFPQYYPPRLGNGQLFVIINNQTMNYEFDSPHAIRVTHFTSVININQTFEVEIQGLLNPVISTLKPFLVILDNNDDQNHIIEYGEVLDWSIPATNPQQITVNNITIESNQVSLSTKYDIEFIMPIAVFQGRNFTVTFSPTWGSLISRVTPVCLIKNKTDVLETDWQNLNCSLRGSKLNVTSWRNYSQNSVYVLRIMGLPNPQNIPCGIDQPIFQIASNDLKYVEYTTYPSYYQFPINFVKADGLWYWKWEIMQNGDFQPFFGQLRLRPGSYSPLLRLRIENNNTVFENIKILLINFFQKYADFQMYPQAPEIKLGGNLVEFRIGCPATTLSGSYEIFFDIVQSSPPILSVPSTLQINVVNELIPIPPLSRSAYSLPVLGLSENIQFDMSNNPPFVPINIDLVLPYYPDIGVDLVMTGRFKISAETPTGFTYLQSNYFFSGMPTDSYLYLDLADDVPNREIFGLPSKNYFNITLLNQPVIPNLYIELGVVSTNNFSVLVNMTERGFLYYSVFKSNLENQTLGGTYAKVQSLLSDNSRIGGYYNKDSGEIAGMLFNDRPYSQIPVQIQNLLDDEEYRAIFWAVNQLGNATDPVTFTIKTSNIPDNFRARVFFQAEDAYNKTQVENLMCYLAGSFAMSSARIISAEGYTCNQQVYNDLINGASAVNSSNTTDNSTNSSIPIIQPKQSVVNAFLGSPTGPKSEFYIYFLPAVDPKALKYEINSVLIQNATSARISPNSDKAWYSDFINNDLASPFQYPLIKTLNFKGEVMITSPVFLSTTVIIKTYNSITLSNVALNGSGFVYSFIEKVKAVKDKGDREVIGAPSFMPDFKQLRLGSNLTSYPSVWASRFDVFTPGNQLDIVYSNLPEGQIYRIYYIATSEDPVQPVTTDVKYIITETFTRKFGERLMIGLSLLFCILYAAIM